MHCLCPGCTQVKVGPTLPMMRLEEGEDTMVAGMEFSMVAGKHVWEKPITVGAPQDFDRLQNTEGVGYLVVSSWGLNPGYAKIQLPDAKAKNPLGDAKKK